ncbi:MAG: 23S rRNA (adenine(2030)-N(6))-methyltransferase RlmJ [Alphaproteobacteria bacterium]|nr:23S rRNA (adenine(2030)-N(6))-methyltransferase RlmJ [Alphaproteobacteria bacterium]
MNYRHAFHAANHADVLKHAVLLHWLAHLRRKPAPFAVLDAHAGAGLYDLAGDAAARSPEWKDGAARLWDWAEAPPLVAALIGAVRAHNPGAALQLYPGSPLLIADALRADDRLIAVERRPEDAAALRRCFRGARNAQIHERDAWEALGALFPFPEKRGLVLIDPPYEAPDELERAAGAVRALLRRAPQAQILWWRPLKDAAALARADAETLALSRAENLRIDLAVAAPERAGPLRASSVLAINPPHTLRDAVLACSPALPARLAQGAGAALAAAPVGA